MAVIRRDAPNPQKTRAATLTVLHEILASVPDHFPGIRDRAAAGQLHPRAATLGTVRHPAF
jgi:hypothetical protein